MRVIEMPFLLLVASLFATGASAAEPNDSKPTEAQKIEALIGHVEALSDAKFVRNGTAYDAKTAGQFLRGKWKARETEIKTAKEFIEKVASMSSTTGKPYLIRLADGREVKSGEYLADELHRLEGKK
jgi:hypothetical protein